MKTIKLIDFLVKIANDELEDMKFKYDGFYYKYWKHSRQIDRYKDEHFDTVVQYNDIIGDCRGLNEEIEIIEDKPRKVSTQLASRDIERFVSSIDIINKNITELTKSVNYLLEKSDKE